MRAAQASGERSASASESENGLDESLLGESLGSVRSRSETSSQGEDAASSAGGDGQSEEGDVFGRSTSSLITKAMRSGRLNIANMGLEQLPREVWTRILGLSESEIEDPLPCPSVTLSRTPSTPSNKSSPTDINNYGAFDTPPHISSSFSSHSRRSSTQDEEEEIPYYEIEDIVAIRASGNALKRLPKQIAMFGALKTLDVSGVDVEDLSR